MRRTVPALFALLVLTASCGGDAGTTTTPGSTVVITATLESGRIGLSVDGATVEPGSVVEVARGDRITMTVTGTSSDEVHVHGYDLAIVPGADRALEFVADIPGIFEVEVEGAGTLLFVLEVS